MHGSKRASLGRIRVEVVLAYPEAQRVVPLTLPGGATIGEALERSGLAVAPEAAVGIFGRRCPRDTPLAHGDRVEIYRPLREDPKRLRRRRAQQTRSRPG